MAVKHKEIDCVEQPGAVDDRLQVMLRALQQQDLPQGSALVRLCETIVHSLGTITVPSNPTSLPTFMHDINNVQEILSNTCATGPNSELLVYATLKALYTDISNPEKKASPAMSIVLQLIAPERIPKVVDWILCSGYPKPGLEQALSTLCSWLSRWTFTPNLGLLVLMFMKGLESQQHYDILVDVTLLYVDRLFLLLILPQHRSSIGPVVMHMLSSMQHSPEGFHRVVPRVITVVTSLHRENTETSRQCLQQIINLVIELMDHFPGYAELYRPIQTIRHLHVPSDNYSSILNCRSWCDNSNVEVYLPKFQGKVGLNNLGNTCYMNSVLQALFMTKMFCNDVLSITNGTVLVAKLQALFALLEHSQRRALSPNDILQLARPPGFIPGHQHDSSEFLGYLLDNLHEQQKSTLATCFEESEMASSSTTISNTAVHRSFGGKTVTVSRCDICTKQSERIDKFRELQLAFPPNASENQSVQTLLDYFLQPERLCGDNQYQCDNCSKLTDGQRVTQLVELPPRLVLTLKHFRYDPASQQRAKLLQRVRLDSCIQLDRFSYELYAAVVHCGSSVDSGHYYTFARDNQSWYKLNDCSVTTSSAEELCELKPPETPYILFYGRQDLVEPEPLTRAALSPSLEAILVRDQAEQDAEVKRRRPRRTAVLRKDHEDEPPPGCGGGSLFDNVSNRFVY